jgi:hypothetical protein
MKRKILLYLMLAVFIGQLILFYGTTQPIQAQTNLRQFLCALFDCQPFIDLAAAIDVLQTDTAQIIAQNDDAAKELGYIKANTTTAAQQGLTIINMVDETRQQNSGIITTTDAIQTTVNNIEANMGAAPALTETLARIEDKLNDIMKPESRIWAKHYIETGTGDLYFEVWIKGESLRDITAWGMDVTFPTGSATYAQFYAGEFLGTWLMKDANLFEPGRVRIGGAAGSGAPIVGPAIGKLFTLRFTGLAGANFAMTMENYVDDIAEMLPQPVAYAIIVN